MLTISKPRSTLVMEVFNTYSLLPGIYGIDITPSSSTLYVRKMFIVL